MNLLGHGVMERRDVLVYPQRQLGPWGPFVGGLIGGLIGGPPGPPPGPPPGSMPGPSPAPGPSGGPPTAPPPGFTPPRPPGTNQVGLLAVDPGGMRRCLFRYTYVWLSNRQQFWFYPVFVGRTSVAGYRWTGFFWVYFGIDLRLIDAFQCF